VKQGANPGAENASRERDGLFEIVRHDRERGHHYCALSPCGRGRLDAATCEKWVKDACWKETPHPFEFAGTSLRPLPQGERARGARSHAFWRNEPNRHFGQTKPANVASSDCGIRSPLRSIVSRLLFTMNGATPTCRSRQRAVRRRGENSKRRSEFGVRLRPLPAPAAPAGSVIFPICFPLPPPTRWRA
jgi:hypothetical protein